MFSKDEYRTEIDKRAEKAATSWLRHSAATLALAAAKQEESDARAAWIKDVKLLEATTRLYVKALMEDGDAKGEA
jgi:hypothetical protein